MEWPAWWAVFFSSGNSAVLLRRLQPLLALLLQQWSVQDTAGGENGTGGKVSLPFVYADLCYKWPSSIPHSGTQLPLFSSGLFGVLFCIFDCYLCVDSINSQLCSIFRVGECLGKRVQELLAYLTWHLIKNHMPFQSYSKYIQILPVTQTEGLLAIGW